MFCVWFFKAIWKQIIKGVNLSFEEEEEEEEEEEKGVVLMPWENIFVVIVVQFEPMVLVGSLLINLSFRKSRRNCL